MDGVARDQTARRQDSDPRRARHLDQLRRAPRIGRRAPLPLCRHRRARAGDRRQRLRLWHLCRLRQARPRHLVQEIAGDGGGRRDRVEECRAFYGDLLGFVVSDKADFSRAPWYPKGMEGNDGYFLRYGTDHHAMVLFSKKVMDHRSDRKFEPGVTINQITWQCGSLKEIVDAHGYFEKHQVRIQRVGRDMPGSNWHTYFFFNDAATTELYYGIEQIGWNQRS